MTRMPRGVFVPSQLIFHTQLSAAVLVSWIKLRSLASDGRSTPPMTLPELASRLGIHPARLARHLAQLQEISALLLRQAGQDKHVISFPDGPGLPQLQPPARQASDVPVTHRLLRQEEPPLAPYFPARILGYLSYDDDERDPLYIENEVDEITKVSVEGTRELSKFTVCHPAEPALVGR